jgi:hypothetical protein
MNYLWMWRNFSRTSGLYPLTFVIFCERYNLVYNCLIE